MSPQEDRVTTPASGKLFCLLSWTRQLNTLQLTMNLMLHSSWILMSLFLYFLCCLPTSEEDNERRTEWEDCSFKKRETEQKTVDRLPGNNLWRTVGEQNLRWGMTFCWLKGHSCLPAGHRLHVSTVYSQQLAHSDYSPNHNTGWVSTIIPSNLI